ncbi:acyl-CoA dehydrogenase family protein [Caldimonas thermodepolymerans]|jgi:acyl-CoA dehydrogenase|uniref:acyl-CoA dehydrogenase family protein n=1 Tax=Caldimonas thermodepolymerans TaxID=215580 RepID=UPI0022362A27|nr:acyl-CoA dehydrogenase family protein [Caldimonas thermodepolymerans]UZG46043.1 acyl-CoA dehydrogenase family protein [Caldimonas thermodepolymerans]
MRDIFESTLDRLLTDLVTPTVLRECESGAWPSTLWSALEESGFALAAASEAMGGAGAGWDDLYVVVRVAGKHALPLPLPETLLANHLLARCGLQAHNEALTIAPRAQLSLEGGMVRGQLFDVPWGRHAAGVLALAGGREPTLVLLDPKAARLIAKQNVAGEPRDDFFFDSATPPIASTPLPADLSPECVWLGGAMLRCAQSAGALEAALELSVQYATERVQFGKPIATFQAIQHQLAVMAEHASCAAVTAEAAFVESVDGFSAFAIGTAKVISAEAAGIVASMAHAVHGAIGFTQEHALQHLTRRLWSWRSEFGNLAHWCQRLGQATCEGGSGALWPTITAGQLELPPIANPTVVNETKQLP